MILATWREAAWRALAVLAGTPRGEPVLVDGWVVWLLPEGVVVCALEDLEEVA